MALIHVLYIILEHVSFNIMFCIKRDVVTLCGFGDIGCIYMDKWALRVTLQKYPGIFIIILLYIFRV